MDQVAFRQGLRGGTASTTNRSRSLSPLGSGGFGGALSYLSGASGLLALLHSQSQSRTHKHLSALDRSACRRSLSCSICAPASFGDLRQRWERWA